MSHPFDSPAVNVWPEDDDQPTPPRPLSGPGTSRQTRRLQLRNAGFRAAAVPTRKVTPKSVSASTMSTIFSGSDAENCSPSGQRAGSIKVEKRRSSGILREIGSETVSGYSTLTRPKKARAKVDVAELFERDPNHLDECTRTASSPPLPPQRSGTIRTKSVRSRPKVSKVRRSMSGEARMYIDHLEAELATAQEQLRTINSPTVTRQQSSKLRTLNAETHQLQQELAEWEAKYEQRVRELEDEHGIIEASLRTQIRSLEDDVEVNKYRVEELETELECSRQDMEATEAANVNLEKRLEIMSSLLAASPTKLDLHTSTPGMSRRHQRPKSMLPRFPTAGFLPSPDRVPRTQPPSPLLAFADLHSDTSTGLDTSDLLSDAESVFSEAPSAGDSITTLVRSPTAPSFNPWAIPTAKSRPARRMRRFGPGSHGPKPLILPSTSNCDSVSTSAPALERGETTQPSWLPIAEDFEQEEDSPSSQIVRRRASTTVNAETLARLEGPPFLLDDSLWAFQEPRSVTSKATSQDFASLGSVAGRNLMDELSALQREASYQSTSGAGDDSVLHLAEEMQAAEHEVEGDVCETTVAYSEEAEGGVNMHSTLSLSSTAHEHSSSTSATLIASGDTYGRTTSTLNRLRDLFSDLWHSPLALARHIVQTAHLRMRIPKPLRNVQWWLVGVLLGPMARRRFLTSAHKPLLEPQSPQAVDEGLAYGTLHENSSSPKIAGKGKKRASRQARGAWSKHSPWVWLKFSITLAFAVGVAFKEGPGSLLVDHGERVVEEGKKRDGGRRVVSAD